MNPASPMLASSSNSSRGSDPDTMVDDLGRPTTPSGFWSSVLDGRYTFAERDPPSTDNWTIVRWRSQLGLTPFLPASELALELWAEENASSLFAARPSLVSFLGVMNAYTDVSYKTCFVAVHDYPVRTFEDFVDVVARALFVTSSTAERLEEQFFARTREPSVRQAVCALQKTVRCYSYIARRRGRDNFLTQPFLASSLVRSVPLVVANRVCDGGDSLPDLGTATQRCQKAEDLLLARHGGGLPEPLEPMAYITATPPPPGGLKTPHECFGCGGDHFRVRCPHKGHRCSKCGKLGHLEGVCRTQVICDNIGNPRVVLKPTSSRVSAEFVLDKTIAAHLNSAKNLLASLEQRNARQSRARRAAAGPRKTSGGRPPSVHQAGTGEVGNPFVVENSSTTDDRDLEITDYSDLCAIASPSRIQGVAQSEVYLNGKSFLAILDTGSSIDIISKDAASAAQVLVDSSVPCVPVNGIGAQTGPMPYSQPASLQFPSQQAHRSTVPIRWTMPPSPC